MKPRRLVLLLLALLLLFALSACRDPAPPSDPTVSPTSGEKQSDPPTDPDTSPGASQTPPVPSSDPSPAPADPLADAPEWTLCWYLCGSNLETNSGCASADLFEAMSIDLPEDVRIVIETGGAYEWQNELTDAGVIQRSLLDSSGFTVLETLPEADMGSPDTLASFLAFCRDNYPARHTGIIFWDHGGGSVSGAVFDEVYGFDSLTLDEFAEAFSQVYTPSDEAPCVDLIGFDACLMATLDTAETFRGYGHYLVASQEVEPGIGWNYAGMLQCLSNNPHMGGRTLGRVICDTYLSGCEEYGVDGGVTLSVADLTRFAPLLDACDALGDEALLSILDSPDFFPAFARCACISENYGGNTPEDGYTDMVDLGSLTRTSSGLLPGHAQQVLDALDWCVVYQVAGPYRAEATGMSCYYPYSADWYRYQRYARVAASDPLTYLYDYALTGGLTAEEADYLYTLAGQTVRADDIPTLADFDLSREVRVFIDEVGYPSVELSPALRRALREVNVSLRQYVFPNGDASRMDIVSWGTSDLIGRNWDTGVFRAYFGGLWAAMEGRALYMEVEAVGDGYTLYRIPILLNGELCSLQVVYEKTVTHLANGGIQTDYGWHILGARAGIDPDTGMADKDLVLLRPGDEITPVYRVLRDATVSGSTWELLTQPKDTFRYTGEDQLDLFADFGGNSLYELCFEFVDARNGRAFSEPFLLWIYKTDAAVQLKSEFDSGLDTAVERWR